MKILTFTSLFPNRELPNSAIFIKHRMAAVHRREDAEVKVVAPVPYFPSFPIGGRWKVFSRIPQFETLDGLEVWHPRYLVTPKVGMTLYGYTMFLGALPTVRKIFQKWPFDIIDAHYVYPDGLAALLLGRVFRRPVVISARGTDINVYPQLKLIRPLMERVISGADHLISVSKSLSHPMTEMGGKHLKVIPNGIDPLSFAPRCRDSARKRLGLNVHANILLSIGALKELKGMHLLVETLALLKSEQQLNFFTCIVGEGQERARLESLIKRYQLEDAVCLIGEVPNASLGDWYYSADLFFLGSSREGWPNVVSESLACGTPVVATPVNGIPEIITSWEYGIVVEREVDQFARALQRGFAHTWDRGKIQRYGQSRTWDSVAEEVVGVFATTILNRQR